VRMLADVEHREREALHHHERVARTV
jgi:hypothetical protein